MLMPLNITTGLVTLCPDSILRSDSVYRCSDAHAGMWCEQAQTAGTSLHQAQPMNALTSLAGVALGAYGLRSAQIVRSGYHRVTCTMMILAGVGSAIHHSFPMLPFSHAVDWIPIFGVVASSTIYALHVLVTRAMRQAPRAASILQDILLLLGLAYVVFGILTYHMGDRGGAIDSHAVLVFGAGVQALAHVAIGCGLAMERPRRPDARALVRAYALTAVAAAIAVPTQQVEHGGCPGWLFSTRLNAHAVWHLSVFYVVYNCATLLLLVELPGEYSSIGACSRVQWLLLKVVPIEQLHVAAARSTRGEDAQQRRALASIVEGTVELTPGGALERDPFVACSSVVVH